MKGLLSYTELCELVEQNVITGVDISQVNGASIDITVGNKFLVEADVGPYVLNWGQRDHLPMVELTDEITLQPQQFCLGQSQQKFFLPDNIVALYVCKSSMARVGLNHANAGYCDPSWNNSVLTLELFNHLHYHAWRIQEGDPIGQMYFVRVTPVPYDRSYAARGRYNNDPSVSGIKP